MLTIAKMTRSRVLSAKGKRIGRIAEVLISAEDSRLVGFIVDRPRLLWLFDRADVYVAFAGVTREDGDFIADGPDALGSRAQKRFGLEWDRTVVWRGMPVLTESGEKVGSVGDAEFADDGRLSRVLLSTGLAADIAVGTREIEAALVRGFDGAAVRVSDAVTAAEFSGGAAAVAGRTAAQASVAAERAAKRAGELAGAAARSETAQAAKAAGAAAGKQALGWLKKASDYVAEGWSDDEQE